MTGPPTKVPAMYHHCIQVYNMMLGESEVYTEKRVDGSLVFDQVFKWTGHLTKLITEQCNLPQPYYSEITEKLRGMNCIDQLKRGGGGGLSEWLLYHQPTQALWEVASEVRPSDRARRPTQNEQLAQQIQDLRELHDGDVAALQMYCERLDERISELEHNNLR